MNASDKINNTAKTYSVSDEQEAKVFVFDWLHKNDLWGCGSGLQFDEIFKLMFEYKQQALQQPKEAEWISEREFKPEFGLHVLVSCRIYGRYLAVYNEIADTGFGEWKDFNGKSCLPPTHWMPLPNFPKNP